MPFNRRQSNGSNVQEIATRTNGHRREKAQDIVVERHRQELAPMKAYLSSRTHNLASINFLIDYSLCYMAISTS